MFSNVKLFSHHVLHSLNIDKMEKKLKPVIVLVTQVITRAVLYISHEAKHGLCKELFTVYVNVFNFKTKLRKHSI